MNPTIICVRHLQIGNRQFHSGQEVPPGLLPDDEIAVRLDRHELAEVRERGAIYRLLHRFSGCSEKERLSSADCEYTL